MLRLLLQKIINKIDLVVPYNRFDRPIFIISPPRSGSTFLFECMAQFEEVYNLRHEADGIWWRHFPYERMEAPSDFIGGAEATPKNIRAIRRSIYKAALANQPNSSSARFWRAHLFGLKNIRYLDKTIASCFHMEFLDRAFPGAQYLFMTREPRATISSMMEGWPFIRRFGKPQLTHIVKSLNGEISHWSYPAPPGWQEVVSQPLAQICAWSWKQHIEYSLRFFEKKDLIGKVVRVRYEDLVEDPLGTITRLAATLGLEMTEKVRVYALKSPLSRTTISPPYKDKWKKLYYEEIVSILPMIKDTAEKIGYDVTVGNGVMNF